MNRFYSFVTYAFFGYAAYLLHLHYGQRWEFGEYGLPHALIAADGMHYLDGTEVELAVRSIVEVDLEVEVQLVLYSIVAVWLFFMVRIYRQMERSRRQLFEAAGAE